MTTVLVTGGLGFIGTHLTRSLAASGAVVRILDAADIRQRPLFDAMNAELSVEVLRGDVRSPAAVAAASNGVDCIVHLAAQIGVNRYLGAPAEVADVIYSGTKVVADAALANGAPLCYVSSSEVYGRNPASPWAEDAERVTGPPSQPRWVYATAKALAEHVIFGRERDGLRFWILRPFNPYGPGLDPNAFVTSSLWRLSHGLPGVLIDGGRQIRCFTYVDDIVDAITRAIARPAAQGQAYNIGHTTPFAVHDALSTLASAAGHDGVKPAVVQRGTSYYGPGFDEASVRIPSTERAQAMLEWQASVPLIDGARATLAWVAEHGWWFDPDAVAPAAG